jgi:chromosome partitioning protein
MDMRVASFIGQKGGVGKSALARVLAVAAAKKGSKTLIADFDREQLTCVEWAARRRRAGHAPEVDAREFKTLKKLRKNVPGYDMVVVDTRGHADDLTEDVAEESDIVFLPTGTSIDDLQPTLALARKLAKHGIADKIVVVLSRIGRSERQLDDAVGTIEDAGFEALEVHWPQRDGFQADLDDGRAGSESANPHLRQSAKWIEEAMLARLGGK